MGGVLSVMTSFQHEIVSGIVPCVTPHAPHPVFLEQTLKDAINWDAMKKTLPAGFNTPQDFLTKYFDLSDMQTFPRFRLPKRSGDRRCITRCICSSCFWRYSRS